MLKCIIVVEKAQTVQVLKNHIRKTPFLELAGTFENSKEALVFLKSNPADLVFFNLHRVPQTDKTQIRIFQLHALVILISSNKSLAYDALEYNVVDFLLNPILFERFFEP